MILGMFGRPGGGKGYEACVYHIMEALKRGRKVITNMPLDVDRWAAIEPAWRDLIEVRDKPLTERQPDTRYTGIHRVFGHVDDYATDWRDAEGRGPFFVIDEAANVMGRGRTPRSVVEWFEMHRHTNSDVMVMTQTTGRLTPDIAELIQTCYFCQKASSFGSMSKYIRKVKDGIKGDVVNTTVRTYEKKYFGLWRSHTQGVAVAEVAASDIVPIWRRWPVVGAAVMLPLGIASLFFIRMPWQAHVKQARSVPAVHAEAASAARASAIAAARASLPASVPASAPASVVAPGVQTLAARGKVGADPFAGYGLHMYGCVSAGARSLCMYAVSQNGQVVSRLTGADLEKAGYTLEVQMACLTKLTWQDVERRAVCDAPTQSVQIAQQGA
ncbi:hypothetical protein F7Q92_04590 [Ideonella dechloratans]|uniref:Zona occludens toxin N-terminal domain-containing protein n=1 Tax=Ideonella dechloratans TaxID=36863 RepID=A0A643FGE6_IDEDE|nr:zonular occludens toxin domain-containing protein [Ideonella dechloratans]KAB0584229.1 hypothetical protein F7Q92_04590 [Ideonella dechloratans]UFU08576.1 hypothetical protein LRM40_09465 [Ideonella dechloratans]